MTFGFYNSFVSKLRNHKRIIPSPSKLLNSSQRVRTRLARWLLSSLAGRRPGPEELCEVYKVSVPDNGLTSEDEDILNYDDIDDPDAFA